MFEARTEGEGIGLVRVPLAGIKTFPLDDLDPPEGRWDLALVAATAGRVSAFPAGFLEAWNRRFVLYHLYVDVDARRRGLGRDLLAHAEGRARALNAREIWLETSNRNVPGFEFYRRHGYRLTGIDLTLYGGTPSETEFALFMSKGLER